MFFPSSLRHDMLGGGTPLARHVNFTCTCCETKIIKRIDSVIAGRGARSTRERVYTYKYVSKNYSLYSKGCFIHLRLQIYRAYTRKVSQRYREQIKSTCFVDGFKVLSLFGRPGNFHRRVFSPQTLRCEIKIYEAFARVRFDNSFNFGRFVRCRLTLFQLLCKLHQRCSRQSLIESLIENRNPCLLLGYSVR